MHELDSDWYSVVADLRAQGWDAAAAGVYLEGAVSDWRLRLSCAKKDFSGLNKELDAYIPTSTNRFLFEGEIALPMEGLVRLVAADRETRMLSGAPLYLVINPLGTDLGELGDVAL